MITKSIKNRLVDYFFKYPTTKLRVRQIEREVKVPLPSVIRYTKELESERILKSEIIAGVKLYSADRTSKIFLNEKRLFNISLLFKSGLIDLLVNELSNPTIIVFGSFAKGEDIERSDIDIYIESTKKIKNLTNFEKKLERNIQIFQYKKINEIKNKELANNIINGIVLNGFLEAF